MEEVNAFESEKESESEVEEYEEGDEEDEEDEDDENNKEMDGDELGEEEGDSGIDEPDANWEERTISGTFLPSYKMKRRALPVKTEDEVI